MNTTPTNLQFVPDHYTGQPEPVQDELVLALSIQRGLLPHQLPISPYFEVHALTGHASALGEIITM